MLVGGEVVGQARRLRVHRRAAERLVVGLLAGGHLHERRSAEEHLRAAVDHDHVVAHAGDVGAARGRVAEHERDGGATVLARAGDVAEAGAAGDEDVLLRRQVGTAGLDEVDRRQPVLLRHLGGAEALLDRDGVGRATLHGRVVGDDHALDALDDADAGDDRAADGEVGAPAGERAELEERGVGVDEQLDALAGGQLAARVVPRDVLLPSPGERLRVLLGEVSDALQHLGAVVGVGGRRRVDGGLHGMPLSSPAASRTGPSSPRWRRRRCRGCGRRGSGGRSRTRACSPCRRRPARPRAPRARRRRRRRSWR